MDTPHIVSLSRQSKAVLKQLQALSRNHELVFPGDINPNKPMSNNTILFALYRMGCRGRLATETVFESATRGMFWLSCHR